MSDPQFTPPASPPVTPPDTSAAPAAAPRPGESEQRIDAILRRRRRVAVAVTLGVIAVLVGVWALWAWDSSRILAAAIARMGARGDPGSMRALHGSPPAPADNAAEGILQAGLAMRLTNDQEDILAVWGRRGPIILPLPAGAIPHARGAEDANRGVFGMIREAALRPRASADDFNALTYHARHLMDLLRTAALVARQGDDDHPPRWDDALARAEELLLLAEILDRCGTTRSRLLATAAYTLVTDLVLDIAPGMPLTGASTGAALVPGEQPASRARVEKLIARLLDERIPHAAARAALLDDQIAAVEYLHTAHPGGWLLHPAYQRDTAATIDACSRARDALAHATWKDISAGMPPEYGAPYDRIMAPANAALRSYARRVALWHVRALVDRRAAAVRLALRLHEVDRGRLPATLAGLVGPYLPAVPIDMFDPQGSPLQLATDGVPRIVSLGVDAVDVMGMGPGMGRGSGMGPRRSFAARSYRWREQGPVYPLSRPDWFYHSLVPATAPATGPATLPAPPP